MLNNVNLKLVLTYHIAFRYCNRGIRTDLVLYKKFGFEKVAERPMAIKLRDERNVSEFIMQKKL